ncbi:uncharacterized protein PAC_17202 [Phialocephala subalpina]|uniref:Mediator of RNA polymerase II transcription subunit 11 n=1 Tax=Phialocephala subalpina TaxID=576137 RepID=A0A1L7XQJ2_9HELO|nr:uncharacterized protein PAC_17202 [Phialocephala subalpina]
MSSPSSEEQEPSSDAAYRPFTKAERIQQLNDIDKSITNLLKSAGQALESLQASTQPPSTRRAVFEHTSNTFLKTLQSIDVRMRRQIYGLEEANIIPAEKAKKAEKAQDTSNIRGMSGVKDAKDEEPPSGDAGLGKLDIGWLNSRSGRVGRDFEAELWEKAKRFLEGMEGTSDGHKVKDEDVYMT